MRPEKQLLVDEVRSRISSAQHLFLVSFTGVTVADSSAFRKALAEVGAQFHIAKNSIINIVAKELGLPDMSEALAGQTGFICGGEDPAAVAKVVSNFFKARDKSDIKLGVLGEKLMSKEEVVHLGSLPSLPELRAQMLSLFNTPARQIVRVIFVKHVEPSEEAQA